MGMDSYKISDGVIMKNGYYIILTILVFAGSIAGVEIADLSWNEPVVQSNINLSWLQERNETVQLAENQANGYDFALSDWSKFTGSIGKYFRKKDNGRFFNYQLPERKDIFNISMSLLAGIDLTYNDNEPYNFQFYGLRTEGEIGKNLFFYSEMWSGHFNIYELSDLSNSPLIDSWSKHSGSQRTIDNVTGKMLYRSNFADIGIGRGKYEIGSNIGGSVILNDHANDYGYFNLDLKLGDFRFSVMNASLVPDSTTSISGEGYADFDYLENKYLAIHKIDWRRGEKLHIFIGEEAVYGGRAPELSYLMPFTIMRIAEHNLGNPDNMLIFAGFDAQISKANTLYFNLILDEMRKAELTTNWWGNKYAMQLGDAAEFDLGFWKRAVFEITMVRPWIYTHEAMITKYSHDGRCLGFPEGSNLIQTAMEVNFVFTERLKFDLNTAFIRQGHTGANWEANYLSEITDIDNEKTALLEGNPENRYKFTGIVSWQLLEHHFLKAGFRRTIFEDSDENYWKAYFSFITRY